jgi:hypothetical protein
MFYKEDSGRKINLKNLLLILFILILQVFLSSCSYEAIDDENDDIDEDIKPADIVLSINNGNPCYVGQAYPVTMTVQPLEASQGVSYNYDTNNINFDKEKMLITFKKTGDFKIACYHKDNFSIKKVIEVTAVFSEDTLHFNMLFVGNSLTKYTYDIPQILKSMLLIDTPYVEIDTIAGTHQYLDQAYNDVRNQIIKKDYTHVFLQEQSTASISYPDRFEAAVESYHNLLTDVDHVLLYQTWTFNISYLNNSFSMQQQWHETIKSAYNRLADTYGMGLSPAGDAFFEVIVNHPEIELFADDHHPSIYGAYLSACVHYVTLTNKSCSDLKYNVLGLDEQICQVLQDVASNTVLSENEAA